MIGVNIQRMPRTSSNLLTLMESLLKNENILKNTYNLKMSYQRALHKTHCLFIILLVVILPTTGKSPFFFSNLIYDYLLSMGSEKCLECDLKQICFYRV